MPSGHLPADTYIAVPFKGKDRGIVEYFVTSNAVVNVYAVDRDGLEQFKRGETSIDCFDSSLRKRNHSGFFRPRGVPRWYLLVQNRSRTDNVAFNYDVFA